MGCVYLARCVVNGKGYVGKTVGKFENRIKSHEKSALNGGVWAFHNALRKYGSDAFRWSVLIEDDEDEFLCFMEQKFIKRLGTKSPGGYNMTDGGDGVSNPSPDVRRRMRFQQLGEVRPNEVKESLKKLWQDPSHRIKMINAHEEQAERMRGKTYEEIYGVERANEERTKRAITRSRSLKEFFSKEENRVTQSVRMKEFFSKEENRIAQSERIKAAWADPEKRKRMLEARRKN